MRRAPVYNWPAIIAIAAIVIVLLWCFWTAFTTPAHAQQGQCGPMDETDANFLKSYNEAISGAGIGEKETDAWTVMVSPDGETFSIVRIYFLMKMACIVGSGHHWAQIPVPHFQEPKQKL